MLEVGNGGMTDEEYQSHFSLWCLVKAPLILGNDLMNMSSKTFDILTNSEAIAVNQDKLGVQGRLLSTNVDRTQEIWGGPLVGGMALHTYLGMCVCVCVYVCDNSQFQQHCR
jgi:alpha-galactosidase